MTTTINGLEASSRAPFILVVDPLAQEADDVDSGRVYGFGESGTFPPGRAGRVSAQPTGAAVARASGSDLPRASPHAGATPGRSRTTRRHEHDLVHVA